METKHSRLIIALGVLFVVAGAAKLLSLDVMVMAFDSWGYSTSLRFVVGMVEAIAGVMLMFQVVHRPAAVMLMPIMIGAAYTHGFRGEWLTLALLPLMLLGVLVWIAFRPSRTHRRDDGWIGNPAMRTR